jgi:hypothetical protein
MEFEDHYVTRSLKHTVEPLKKKIMKLVGANSEKENIIVHQSAAFDSFRTFRPTSPIRYYNLINFFGTFSRKLQFWVSCRIPIFGAGMFVFNGKGM